MPFQATVGTLFTPSSKKGQCFKKRFRNLAFHNNLGFSGSTPSGNISVGFSFSHRNLTSLHGTSIYIHLYSDTVINPWWKLFWNIILKLRRGGLLATTFFPLNNSFVKSLKKGSSQTPLIQDNNVSLFGWSVRISFSQNDSQNLNDPTMKSFSLKFLTIHSGLSPLSHVKESIPTSF